MKILVVDNYDSFTWNLYHYLEQLASHVDVFRNNDPRCMGLDNYDGVVISPGPGMPEDSGLTPAVIAAAAGRIPVLGVCLGLQAMVCHFGGRLINLPEVLHGKQCDTNIICPDSLLFKGLPDSILTGHYHSWVADPAAMPASLRVTAASRDGKVMAVDHHSMPLCGVQFHPESVLTPYGFAMMENWIVGVKNKYALTAS